ncbi:hypothetical protein D9M68_888830 [compost metagenome]
MPPGVFIDHVVGHGAVFVERLRAALAVGLGVELARAFDAVAQNRAADQADHGGRGTASAIADRIACGAAGDAAEQGACARFLALVSHALVAAHLARHGHLLHHRRAADHAALFFLGVRHTAAGQGKQARSEGNEDGGFHEQLLMGVA